jgi:hypothetical protein
MEEMYHEIGYVSPRGNPPLNDVIVRQAFSQEFLHCCSQTVKLETSFRYLYQVVGHPLSGGGASFAVTVSCNMLQKLRRRDDMRQIPGVLQGSRQTMKFIPQCRNDYNLHWSVCFLLQLALLCFGLYYIKLVQSMSAINSMHIYFKLAKNR